MQAKAPLVDGEQQKPPAVAKERRPNSGDDAKLPLANGAVDAHKGGDDNQCVDDEDSNDSSAARRRCFSEAPSKNEDITVASVPAKKEPDVDDSLVPTGAALKSPLRQRNSKSGEHSSQNSDSDSEITLMRRQSRSVRATRAPSMRRSSIGSTSGWMHSVAASMSMSAIFSIYM